MLVSYVIALNNSIYDFATPSDILFVHEYEAAGMERILVIAFSYAIFQWRKNVAHCITFLIYERRKKIKVKKLYCYFE